MPIPLGILAVAGAGAGAASDFDLLETTLISTNTASVTFSNLNNYSSDYKHLQLRATVRTSAAVGGTDLRVTLNGDTGANYSFHYLYGTGSSVASGGNANTSWIYGSEIETANSTANVFSPVVMDLLDVFSANKNTTARVMTAKTTAPSINMFSGVWRNTAAVTSLTAVCGSGNFAAGCRLSLYGIKG